MTAIHTDMHIILKAEITVWLFIQIITVVFHKMNLIFKARQSLYVITAVNVFILSTAMTTVLAF